MSQAHQSPTDARRGEDVALGAVAAVAYVAFGVFALMHDDSPSSVHDAEPFGLATSVGGDPGAGAADAARVGDIAGHDSGRDSESDKPARSAARSLGSTLERMNDAQSGSETRDPAETAGETRTASVDIDRVQGDRAQTETRGTTRSLGAGIESQTGLANDPSVVRSGETPVGNLNMQFLVKFDAAEAERWRELYRSGPDAARAEFEALARRNSAFAGLRFVSINYSGVATLEFAGDPPPVAAAREALSADIVRRIGASEHVEYVEPNLVGWRETSEQ